MNAQNLTVYILLESMKTEVEGMKAENALAISKGDYPSYREQDFIEVSQRMHELVNEVNHENNS